MNQILATTEKPVDATIEVVLFAQLFKTSVGGDKRRAKISSIRAHSHEPDEANALSENFSTELRIAQTMLFWNEAQNLFMQPERLRFNSMNSFAAPYTVRNLVKRRWS